MMNQSSDSKNQEQHNREHQHPHHHEHSHAHSGVFHSHAPAGKMKKAFFLTAIILLVEFSGGLLSHSLALLSDAGHVLTDIAAIGLSWYALRQAQKPSDENMTFGYSRSGILAALINAIALILITVWILFEAVHRFRNPEPVHSTWMFISAAVGLSLNLYLGLSMHREDDLNVRSAVLHMLGDAAASAGVIAAGVVIVLSKWYMVDPLLSVGIAVLIAVGAWRILRQTLQILMEGTPQDIDFQGVIREMNSVSGIHDVHDVHVWCISSGRNALSCHVILNGDMTIRESQAVLRELEHRLVHMGIGHITIQTEDQSHPHDDSDFCVETMPAHSH